MPSFNLAILEYPVLIRPWDDAKTEIYPPSVLRPEGATEDKSPRLLRQSGYEGRDATAGWNLLDQPKRNNY